MIRSNLLFLIIALIWCGCDTAGNVDPVFEKKFIKYYGDEGDQFGADIAINDDGTMLLLGNSVLPDGTSNAMVIKVDSEGNRIWETAIGNGVENAVDIELFNDGAGIVVVSNVGVPAASKIRLSILSQNGELLNSKVVNEDKVNFYQVAKSVTCLEERAGFVVAGYADNTLIKETTPSITPSNDVNDIMAFEFDANLNFLDTIVTKGGELNGSAIKVFETKNPATPFVMFGYSDRPYLTNDFRYNFTYDLIASGVPIGSPVGSEDEIEELASVITTPPTVGEGYLMAGTSRAEAGGRGDLYIVKMNASLENKSIDRKVSLEGRDLRCVAATNAPFGYYLLANEFQDAVHHDMCLVRTSSDGTAEWVRNFGTSEGDDTAAAVATLPDGRVVIVGTMELKTRKKLALIVIDGMGDF